MEELGGVSFGVPAVHFGKFRFQFGHLYPVFIGEVRLGVEGVFFLHDLVQLGVALNHGVHDRAVVKGEVVLV